MARDIKSIAKALGAEVVGRVPETGGGAFGAAKMAMMVAALRQRLRPGVGLRPGRPGHPDWSLHPKVPMSPSTKRKLQRLAKQVSSEDRKVSPMQVAGQLLEQAVTVMESAS